MRTFAISLVVATIGCGRIGFSERSNVTADAGVDAPLFLRACPGVSLDCDGALTCHDFEVGGLDPWSYECSGDNFECDPAIPEAVIEVTETPPCNGDKVYRAYTEGGPDTRQNAYVGQLYRESPLAEIYVRFAMRWPAGTNIVGQGLTLVPLDIVDKLGPRFGFGRTLGEMRLKLFDNDRFFAAPTVADQWTCVELHLGANVAEVWIDGESVYFSEEPSFDAEAKIEGVTLGITGSSDDGETEIFFDDFAVAPARIGCVPAD